MILPHARQPKHSLNSGWVFLVSKSRTNTCSATLLLQALREKTQQPSCSFRWSPQPRENTATSFLPAPSNKQRGSLVRPWRSLYHPTLLARGAEIKTEQRDIKVTEGGGKRMVKRQNRGKRYKCTENCAYVQT